MNITYKDEYTKSLLDKYADLVKKLKSVDDGTTIGELIARLESNYKLIIVAGDNSSGIDIVDLMNEEIDEWTW